TPVASLSIDADSLKRLVGGDVDVSGGKLVLRLAGLTIEVGNVQLPQGVVVRGEKLPFAVRVEEVVLEPGSVKVNFQVVGRGGRGEGAEEEPHAEPQRRREAAEARRGKGRAPACLGLLSSSSAALRLCVRIFFAGVGVSVR